VTGCYTHSFVSEYRPYIFLSLCFLAGCANIPDSYAPPVQRKPLTGADPSPIGTFVNLGEPGSDAYVVRDITDYAPPNSWRWTRKRPELRFFLDSTEHVKFKADFSVADATLKDTGPVTISVFINGNLLGAVKCAAAGRRQFEKPVPPALLHSKAINFAALEIDKVWVSKTDGAVLGFILTSAGFTP
jgi:hypothetical protein